MNLIEVTHKKKKKIQITVERFMTFLVKGHNYVSISSRDAITLLHVIVVEAAVLALEKLKQKQEIVLITNRTQKRSREVGTSLS